MRNRNGLLSAAARCPSGDGAGGSRAVLGGGGASNPTTYNSVFILCVPRVGHFGEQSKKFRPKLTVGFPQRCSSVAERAAGELKACAEGGKDPNCVQVHADTLCEEAQVTSPHMPLCPVSTPLLTFLLVRSVPSGRASTKFRPALDRVALSLEPCLLTSVKALFTSFNVVSH